MKFKQIICMLILNVFFLHYLAFSQSNFVYDYDNNGNRELRQLSANNQRLAASPLVEEEPKEELSQSVTVFPNPSTGIYQVSIPQAAEEAVELKVFNLSGSLIYTNPNPKALTGVNLQGQPTGIYLFKIKTNSETTIKRVLKD